MEDIITSTADVLLLLTLVRVAARVCERAFWIGIIALIIGIKMPRAKAYAQEAPVGNMLKLSSPSTSFIVHKVGVMRKKAVKIEGRTNVKDFRTIKKTKLF